MPLLPITLTTGFSPIVQSEDIVQVGQTIAKKAAEQEVSINIATEIGVEKNNVVKYLKKGPGDSVKPGDIVAIKKGLFGKTKAKVISTAEGMITRYERASGLLYMKMLSEHAIGEELLVSPIEGKISLCNNEKIVIETERDVSLSVKGFGGQCTGTIKVTPHGNQVELYHLNAEAIGKILVGTFFSRDVLIKAMSMDVSGIITTKILDADVDYLKTKKAQIPVLEITEQDMKKMIHWDNKNAFIDGKGKVIILLHS